MAQVVLLVDTHYGSPYKKGDVTTVPDRVADRWVNSGIARYVDEEAPAGERVDYNSFYATELQQIARERGIEGYDSMKKAELVAALNAYDAENLTDPANTTVATTDTSNATAYTDYTVDDLRAEAKSRNLEGYSSLNKAELVELLLNDDREKAAAETTTETTTDGANTEG